MLQIQLESKTEISSMNFKFFKFHFFFHFNTSTPLLEAARGGHLEVIKYLVQNKANLNALNNHGK